MHHVGAHLLGALSDFVPQFTTQRTRRGFVPRALPSGVPDCSSTDGLLGQALLARTACLELLQERRRTSHRLGILVLVRVWSTLPLDIQRRLNQARMQRPVLMQLTCRLESVNRARRFPTRETLPPPRRSLWVASKVAWKENGWSMQGHGHQVCVCVMCRLIVVKCNGSD